MRGSIQHEDDDERRDDVQVAGKNDYEGANAAVSRLHYKGAPAAKSSVAKSLSEHEPEGDQQRQPPAEHVGEPHQVRRESTTRVGDQQVNIHCKSGSPKERRERAVGCKERLRLAQSI